jgi:hypothetical protein
VSESLANGLTVTNQGDLFGWSILHLGHNPEKERSSRLRKYSDPVRRHSELGPHDPEARCLFCTVKPYLQTESIRSALRKETNFGDIMHRFQPSDVPHHFEEWAASVEEISDGSNGPLSSHKRLLEYHSTICALLTTMLRQLAGEKSNFLPPEWTTFVAEVAGSKFQNLWERLPEKSFTPEIWIQALMSSYVLLLSYMITAPNLISGILSTKVFDQAAMTFDLWDGVPIGEALLDELDRRLLVSRILSVMSLVFLNPMRMGSRDGTSLPLGANQYIRVRDEGW